MNIITEDKMNIITMAGAKVHISRTGIALFNAQWPCSELRSVRPYWFEFANNGDLVDTDVPEQDDGAAASALANDCREFYLHGTLPAWLPENTQLALKAELSRLMKAGG